MPTRSEFSGGGRILLPHTTRVVLYHMGYLVRGYPARYFDRNETFPFSVGFLPLDQVQTNKLHVNTASVLHRSFLWLQPDPAKIEGFRVFAPWLGAELPLRP